MAHSTVLSGLVADTQTLGASPARKALYASNRWWLFFDNNGNLYYTTSSDGATWSTPTLIVALTTGLKFSIWYDEIHLKVWLAYTAAGTAPPTIVSGSLPSNGVIGWDASHVATSSGGTTQDRPAVCMGGEYKVWALWGSSGGGALSPVVCQATGPDGSVWGTVTTLRTNTNPISAAVLIPFSNGNCAAVWDDGSSIYYSFWNGTIWSTAATVTTTCSGAEYFGAIPSSTNDNEIMVAWRDGTVSPYTIKFKCIRMGGITGDNGTLATSSANIGQLSVTRDRCNGNMIVAWADSGRYIKAIMYYYVTDTWGAVATLYDEGSNVNIQHVQTTQYASAAGSVTYVNGVGGLFYLKGSNPYTIVFEGIAQTTDLGYGTIQGPCKFYTQAGGLKMNIYSSVYWMTMTRDMTSGESRATVCVSSTRFLALCPNPQVNDTFEAFTLGPQDPAVGCLESGFIGYVSNIDNTKHGLITFTITGLDQRASERACTSNYTSAVSDTSLLQDFANQMGADGVLDWTNDANTWAAYDGRGRRIIECLHDLDGQVGAGHSGAYDTADWSFTSFTMRWAFQGEYVMYGGSPWEGALSSKVHLIVDQTTPVPQVNPQVYYYAGSQPNNWYARAMSDVHYTNNIDNVVNSVTLTGNGITSTASDAASIAANGLRSKSFFFSKISNQTDLDNLAARIIAKFKNPTSDATFSAPNRLAGTVNVANGYYQENWPYAFRQMGVIQDSIAGKTVQGFVKKVEYDSRKPVSTITIGRPTIDLSTIISNMASALNNVQAGMNQSLSTTDSPRFAAVNLGTGSIDGGTGGRLEITTPSGMCSLGRENTNYCYLRPGSTLALDQSMILFGAARDIGSSSYNVNNLWLGTTLKMGGVVVLDSSKNVYANLLSQSVTVASNTDQFTNLAANNNGQSTSYIAVKSIRVNCVLHGFRVYHEMSNSAGATSYSRVYKNGVPWGAEHFNNTGGGGYVAYTDDLMDANPGDIIEIWAKSSANYTYVQNFRIRFDLTTVTATSTNDVSPVNAPPVGNIYMTGDELRINAVSLGGLSRGSALTWGGKNQANSGSIRWIFYNDADNGYAGIGTRTFALWSYPINDDGSQPPNGYIGWLSLQMTNWATGTSGTNCGYGRVARLQLTGQPSGYGDFYLDHGNLRFTIANFRMDDNGGTGTSRQVRLVNEDASNTMELWMGGGPGFNLNLGGNLSVAGQTIVDGGSYLWGQRNIMCKFHLTSAGVTIPGNSSWSTIGNTWSQDWNNPLSSQTFTLGLWTAPVNGVYMIDANIQFVANFSGIVGIWLWNFTDSVWVGHETYYSWGNGNYPTVHMAQLLLLTGGKQYCLKVCQGSAGTQTLDSGGGVWFAAHLLARTS